MIAVIQTACDSDERVSNGLLLDDNLEEDPKVMGTHNQLNIANSKCPYTGKGQDNDRKACLDRYVHIFGNVAAYMWPKLLCIWSRVTGFIQTLKWCNRKKSLT